MKCWASWYCKRVNSPLCNEECDIHVILKALYKESRIPKKLQYEKSLMPSVSDRPKFLKLQDFMFNILDNVEEGNGLYIYSETTGNGKTTWATKIANYYLRKVVFNTSLEYEAYYINTPDFLEAMRLSYDSKSDDFEGVVDRVMNSKLLIIDDIGSEKMSEWVTERLYTIINNRVSNELSTLYTSNVKLDMLEEKLNSRIVSRILGSTEVIQLSGKDERRCRADV